MRLEWMHEAMEFLRAQRNSYPRGGWSWKFPGAQIPYLPMDWRSR